MKTFLFVLTSLFLIASNSHAQIPRTLSYQGVLTDSSGGNARNGDFAMTFRLYSGSTVVWAETKTLPVKNGLFSTNLGDAIPFSDTVKFDKPYSLGIQVGAEPELSPRIPLTSVGYSMNALRADTARVALQSDGIWSTNGPTIYTLSGRVGLGTDTPASRLTIKDSNFVAFDIDNVNTSFSKQLRFKTNNSLRWYIGASGLETGSNDGSDLFVVRRDDAGENLGTAFFIDRATGNVGIGTSSPDAKLTVAESGDQAVLLELRSERSWEFRQEGTGAATALKLKSVGGGGNKDFIIETDGEVGIGTTSPSAKLHVAGRTKTEVLEITGTGGSDLAEPFEISHAENLPAGSLVVIDDMKAGALKLSDKPYDPRVAGVLSGAGGLNAGVTLGHAGFDGRAQNVALSGRAYARATAANGPIRPGDFLTTSNVPGHAMRATDKTFLQGTIIGKAMSSLEDGEGLVLVLINLQ